MVQPSAVGIATLHVGVTPASCSPIILHRLHTDVSSATAGNKMALVAYQPGTSCSQDIVVREQLMVERRKDQERHSHKQIWTKKPHGGPYVKERP